MKNPLNASEPFTQGLLSLRGIYRDFLDDLQLSRMCSRSYTIPLFSVCNIAAGYALGGQKKIMLSKKALTALVYSSLSDPLMF
jgi:hypothetical protein